MREIYRKKNDGNFSFEIDKEFIKRYKIEMMREERWKFEFRGHRERLEENIRERWRERKADEE